MVRIPAALLLLQLRAGFGIPIDNAVASQPEILCLQDSMRILIDTQKAFNGHIYVKGMFLSNPSCHLDLTRSLTHERKAVFNVPYRSCTTNRERSLRPAGLSYSAVVIIQFHHLFITKVDRAYRLTCFYMESTKIVTQGMHVSMLPTTELSDTRPMPTCRYEVLYGSLDGAPVRFAKVGDKVFHKWTCESGAHGMLVHSCVARDGAGAAYELVDKAGCAVDPIALGDLSYSNDLTMAFTQVHVFKFADQMVVNFQCQISLCVHSDAGCDGLTPPRCPGLSPLPNPVLPPGPYSPNTAPQPAPREPDYAPAPQQPRGDFFSSAERGPIQTIGLDGRPLIPSPLDVGPGRVDFEPRGPLPAPAPAPLPVPGPPLFPEDRRVRPWNIKLTGAYHFGNQISHLEGFLPEPNPFPAPGSNGQPPQPAPNGRPNEMMYPPDEAFPPPAPGPFPPQGLIPGPHNNVQIFPPSNGFPGNNFPAVGPNGEFAFPAGAQRRAPRDETGTTMYPPERPMPEFEPSFGRNGFGPVEQIEPGQEERLQIPPLHFSSNKGRRFSAAGEPGRDGRIQIDPQLFGVEQYQTFRPPLPQVQKRDVPEVGRAVVEGTLDVTSDDMIVFNLDDSFPQSFSGGNGSRSSIPRRFLPLPSANGEDVCLSKLVLIQIISATVLFFSSLTTVLAFLQRRYYLSRIGRARKSGSSY